MEEDQISLKYIFRSFKRHWLTIVYFTCCFLVVGVVYAKLMNPPTYRSVGVLVTTNSSADTNPTITSIVTNEQAVAEVVYQNLKTEGVHHKNGSEVSLSEISSGISVESTTSNLQIQIVFTNSDETIVERVLNEVLDVSFEVVDSRFHNIYYPSIVSYASEPINIARSNVVIIGLSTVAGAIIGAVCTLVEETRQNSLYEINDIKKIDTNVFNIEYTKEKKHEISK
ncbi:MAG: hypothetical protein J1F32_02520 [Erysipelotrichales bacterium]|nr:hypothetical protein [Erysipelotrichales bacterium]